MSYRLKLGEIKAIKLRNLRNFSLGNQDVIGAKYDSSSQVLLLRAKGQGRSDLFYEFVNSKNKIMHRNISIIVDDDRSPAKIQKPRVYRKALKKTAKPKTKKLLNSWESYQKLLQKKDHRGLHLYKLSLQLKSIIWEKFLKATFSYGLTQWRCHFSGVYLACHIPKKTQKLTFLKKDFFLHFYPIPNCLEENQYQIRLKVFQVEDYSGRELSLGLDRLHSQLSRVFESGGLSLIQDNLLGLYEKELSLSTVVEKEAKIMCGEPFEFKVGAEIPFQTSNPIQGVNTQWKFAGLKVKGDVEQTFLHKRYLNYQTEFSSPTESGGISGSQQKSRLHFSLRKNIKLFEVGFHAQSKGKGGIPWLKEIPLLGLLFQSSEQKKSYKKIFAIVQIKELHGSN